MPSYDAIVIGAGHNGLACAGLLARSGRSVLVLEAAEEAGGAARTVSFAPGFSVSAVAHILNQLHPSVVKALRLDRHGLDLRAAPIATTLLAPDGRHLTLSGAFGETIEGDLPAADRAAWPSLRAKLMRQAATLGGMLTETPPRLKGGTAADWLTLGKFGLSLRRLGRDDMREALRMMLMNVADALEEELTDDRLKGGIAFDAVLGTHFGPRSPNSLMTLLYRLAGESSGRQAALVAPRGGMGTVGRAFRAAAEAEGATVRTGAPVARILVEEFRACGVELVGGETIRAGLVVSAADPRQTFLDLVGPAHLDTGFLHRIRNVRARGNVARIHLGLDGAPRFSGLAEAALGGRLVIAPSIAAIEGGFDAAKYGGLSPEPALEIVLPTIGDRAMAPDGHHVLSINAIYAPYRLKQGWESGRDELLSRVVAVLERHAPGLAGQIVAKEVVSPADLEARYRLPGGHWHHGELSIDQMFMLRPVQEAAQYATPLPGLWLCGAGSHPGGGVMGVAGTNAARRILKETRR